ncbi:GNAT family N-acetyltransferase [Pseudoramibacter sp.]|jgi:predicted GNAT family acetyltransferase|uniref:GNAT family N-acetyltransferase n=1 Tax=Pseudoramibacter sp. TaxID=2034862 RepID=UPI0025D9218D|nr:GNAT family N-acetyltransferase [Pseudoramibacter sp.]MCH4071952.1 N-acetyltransferase [Pseudoramibacter sp.]MCH4105720.1 N-acetyltransferase [Pseudoramibacter sp.]
MVTIEFRPEEMRAVALDQGKVIGECTVTASGRIWLLTHTEVDKAYGGQGIAGQLVDSVVEAARQQGIKIHPLCDYAQKRFTRHRDYDDVKA